MTITPSEALSRCIEHREIFHDEMLHLMRLLMRGEMSPTLASALLMGLRVKKETIGEITAAATVMREFATPVQTPNAQDLLDLCGTGGDGTSTFNISTTAMFVAAAAGCARSQTRWTQRLFCQWQRRYYRSARCAGGSNSRASGSMHF